MYPARHFASSLTNRDLPAMRQRVRLEESFDVSGFPFQARVVLRALKRYGMIVADNGSDWFISGSPSKHWDNNALHTLGRCPVRALKWWTRGSSGPKPPGVRARLPQLMR